MYNNQCQGLTQYEHFDIVPAGHGVTADHLGVWGHLHRVGVSDPPLVSVPVTHQLQLALHSNRSLTYKLYHTNKKKKFKKFYNPKM